MQRTVCIVLIFYCVYLMPALRLVDVKGSERNASVLVLPTCCERDAKDYKLMATIVNTNDYYFTPHAPEKDCVQGLINPALLQKTKGKMWMALRLSKHCMSTTRKGFDHWYSQLAFGSVSWPEGTTQKNISTWNLSSFQLLKDEDDPRLDRAKGLVVECLPRQDSYTQGPEDPHLFTLNGQTYVMFIGSDFVKPIEQGRPQCVEHGLHPHIVPLHEVYPAVAFGKSVPAKIEGGTWVDKNWGLFPFAMPDQTEKLLGVYHMYPHSIIELDVKTGWGKVIQNTSSSLLEQLAQTLNIPPEKFHGGPDPQLLKPCPFNEETSCYIGVFHALDQKYRTIGNWPYLFSARPPFDIMRVGRRLDLTHGGRTNFVSSIVLDRGSLMLVYNSDDRESRVYNMLLDGFISSYFDLACSCP